MDERRETRQSDRNRMENFDDDDLRDLAAAIPVLHARGPNDDTLTVPHMDAHHFCTDSAAGSSVLAEYLAARQPVVFDRCVDHWPARHRWTHGYLRTVLGVDSLVHVARTPNGLGDAISSVQNGMECFAKPHEVQMSFGDFVDAVESPLRDAKGGAAAAYAAEP